MNKLSLLKLYLEHKGKAAHKWSSYLNEYDRLFQDFRDVPISILEIGVQNGGSLDIWSKYFKKACTIVGVDINPKCSNLIYDDPRIHIVIGNINDPQVIENILYYSSQFDIIIDDGSHESQDIITTFVNFFPILSKNGVFIVEDLHCSYWQTFGGGIFYPFSSMAFFQKLVDILNFEHWGVEKTRENLIRDFIEKYNLNIDSKILEDIYSIEFLNSMCVLKKFTQREGLGYHIAIGDSELVVQGNLKLNSLPYEFDPIFIQNKNYWSTLESPPANILYQIQAKLNENEQQKLKLENDVYDLIDSKAQIQATLDEVEQQRLKLENDVYDLIDSKAQIQATLDQTEQQRLKLIHEIHELKTSIYWKITSPLRSLVHLLRSSFNSR